MSKQKEQTLMQSSSNRVPVCWVVSNGRAGTQNQVLGLAEALAQMTPLSILVKSIDIQWPWLWVPTPLWPNPFSLLTRKGHLLRPPLPDLWLAAGRHTVPFTIDIKKRASTTFTVQTQDPKAPAEFFDLIIPPEHDRVVGENVFPIIGAPTRLTVESINHAVNEEVHRFSVLPSPRLAILIGGSSKAYRLTDDVMVRLLKQMKDLLAQGYSLMITTSRRTEADHEKMLREALMDNERVCFVDEYHEGRGNDNLYPALLGMADFILVTEDSVNMICDAAVTGKPIYTLSLEGKGRKFLQFHQTLKNQGIVRPFEGKIQYWKYQPLTETYRAAEEVLRRWQSR